MKPSPPPLFETHITISPLSDLSPFQKTCADLDVKYLALELPAGDVRLQPMTASFVRAPLDLALANARALAGALTARGFEVVRTKLEQHGRGEDLSRTDSSYLEYHGKIAYHPRAGEIVAALGGAISANTARAAEQLVTLRVSARDVPSADARWNELVAALGRRGAPVRSRVRELVVVDTNPALDRGWSVLP